MSLRKTHLYNFHRDHGRLIEFAGFEHAVWYEGIIPEHLAVRNAVGIFDVTHMGRCTVKGRDSADFLDYLLTREISPMEITQGHYSVMCNERGGIIDDLTAFRLAEDHFFLVYNASNREKDYAWIRSHAKDFNVETRDVSDEVVMLALQGPKAVATLQSICESDLSKIRRYWCQWATIGGFKVLLSRTGYTGEDGFEIYLWDTPMDKPENAEKFWLTILEAGKAYNIKPCGLGARDTLRLEAGMSLYGNEIDENTTPLEAKLEFTVRFDKDDFIGKDALLQQKAEGLKRVRIGLRLLERGIPRHGDHVFVGGERKGQLTSGTFSPLLKCGIGMGYVSPEYATEGTHVNVKIREKLVSAEIVRMPFYDTTRYGRTRKHD